MENRQKDMEKTVILLNGPSSSGKSSISAALQRTAEGRGYGKVAAVSIDDFVRVPQGDRIYEDDVWEISEELNAAVVLALKSSQTVTVDHVMTSPRIYEGFMDAVRGYRTFRVLVRCDADELERREAARGDRSKGTAADSLEYLYPSEGYDLTVDTTFRTPQECAADILDGLEEPGCPVISIEGLNYSGRWDRTRRAARGILTEEGKILLSYEKKTDTWMIPGGGMENGESWMACCAREVAEETGYLFVPQRCVLKIEEFYEDVRYLTEYYLGESAGTAGRKLTAVEEDAGLESRWVDITEAVGIFSRHAEYADTDEMKRGLYQREHTALTELLGEGTEEE